MEFNPRLHGLRALAACGVLLFHWAQFFPVHAQLHANTETFGFFWHLSLAIGFGWMGVPLFFVLSGYLLTRQWRDRPLNVASVAGFWRRRFLRIYPAVWVQLILLVSLAGYLPGLPDAGSWGSLLANGVLYLHLPPLFVQPLNGVWWTLPVELAFYLLLPALVALQRVTAWGWVLLGGALVSIAWRLGVIAWIDEPGLAPYQVYLDALPGSLVYFCAGFALAFLPAVRSAALGNLGVIVVAGLLYLSLVFLAFRLDSYWSGDWLLIVWPLAAAVLVSALVWLLSQPLVLSGWLGNRLLVRLGEISFGLYLWHFPVLRVLGGIWPQGWVGPIYSLLGLFVCILVTVLLAELSFRWVENPLMRWRPAREHRQ